MARKSNDTVQLNLRFSEELRRRLEREAARSGRSMNAEIIHRVEETFRQAEHDAWLLKEVELVAKTAATTTFELAAKTAAAHPTIGTLAQRWVRGHKT